MPDEADVRRPGRIASKIAIVRRLSWSDRSLLLEAGCLVTVLRLTIGAVGVRRVYNALERLTPHSRGTEPGSHTSRVVEITRVSEIAFRHEPFAATCLHRSLALWWLLRRRGLDSDLRFGARRRDGRLEAHAWVEHRGMVLNDHPAVERTYVPLQWISAERDA